MNFVHDLATLAGVDLKIRAPNFGQLQFSLKPVVVLQQYLHRIYYNNSFTDTNTFNMQQENKQ